MPRPSSLCTSQRAPETVNSPLPSVPSTSPSSPSSLPSSPSSPSSISPRRMGTGYHEDKDSGHTVDNHVSKAAGDKVSSTSLSLGSSSLSLPQLSSLNQSQRAASSPLLYGNAQRQDIGMEIYDPFQPTEGDGVPGTAEDEGDKYDPFEPTGSPGSEKEEEEEEEEEIDREQEEEEGSIQSETKDANEFDLNSAAEAESPPPDSTETPLASAAALAELDGGRRLKERTKERGKSSKDRRLDDSEHSEIEEGEIVGPGECVRERELKIRREVLLASPKSPSFLQGGGLKPERILRVLDGEDFVSVRAEGEWDREPAPPIGVGDLRRKLTNRRKQRFRSCPSSASISPPPLPIALSLPSPSPPASPPLSIEKSRSRKSSKCSKERDRRKRKGEKDKRKKRKDLKGDSERASGESKDRDHERKHRRDGKEKDKERSHRSHSRTRKSVHQSTPEPAPHSHNASRHAHGHRSFSRERDRDREKDKERNRERDRYRDRRRDDREKDKDKDSRRRDERKRERDEVSRRSSSREEGHAKRRRESSEGRNREKERGRERERDRRRDGRPVVPPSIQDLNGSDLFAIKRTITLTPAPTAMVSGSPPHARDRTRSPMQGSDKSRKRKRKRRRCSDDEERPEEEHRSRSRPSSLTSLRYHGYESDHLSERPEPDMLSLDGEALDSDYPSLEDSPLLPPPPEPLLPSPKPKASSPKSRYHQTKKSRSGSKKLGQSESSTSSSSHRPKAIKPSPLSASSGNAASLVPPASSSSVKRARKTGKDKLSKKDPSRSGRSKKPGGRKAKLQSKVSVLVREGVSSTTGNSSKLGLDLLGPSGPTGASVVGGSIAVVFRRDNESRSPFLKPCSEPLSLPARAKDLNKTGKQRNSLRSLSSANPPGLKSKKVKPSSTTSTSSSASSPTSSSVTKRRRRPGKKPREKGITVDGPDGKSSNNSTLGSGWTPTSADLQPLGGVGPKPSSPPSTLPGPTPSSSSSSSSSTSSTSVLPPSSSPPHTPPLSLPPSRDTRESSPDSQTVDSSCKTPEPSFLMDECPAQSQSTMLPPSQSPPSPPPPRGEGMSQSASKPLSPDDHKSSSPCPTSSALGTSLLSHSIPPPVAEPSSSSSASVSSSSVSKLLPPPPPPSTVPPLPWSLQTGVDCTAGGVLALTALLFKMEEANLANRAKAQEFIQATSQILSQANQNQSQTHSSSSTSQVPPPPPPPPSHAPPSGPSPAQFILHGSLPLVGCTKIQPSHVHPGLSLGGGCAQTPPPLLSTGTSGGASETGWDSESKDPDKYLKKLHTQERAVEEVKLAIKPYYQRKDINKDEYKDILRKAVHKICHSRTGEINPVKVSNLVKLYVQRYKYFRKHGRKMDEEDKEERESASLHSST